MSEITAEDLYSLDRETLIKPSDEGWWEISSNEYKTFKDKNLYNKTYITCAFLIYLNRTSTEDSEDYYALYYGNLGDTFNTNKGYDYDDEYYTITEVYVKPTIRIWNYSSVPQLSSATDDSSYQYTKEQIQKGLKFDYNPYLFCCKWLDRENEEYVKIFSYSLYSFVIPLQNSYVIYKIDSSYYMFRMIQGQTYWGSVESGITIVGFWSQLETTENYSLNKISNQLYSYLKRNYCTTFYNSNSNTTKLVIKTKDNSNYLFYANPEKIPEYAEYFETTSLLDSLDSATSQSDLFNILKDTSYQIFIAFQSNMKYFYSQEYDSSSIYPDNLSQLKCFYTVQETSNDDKYFCLTGDAYFKQGETGYLSNNSETRKIKSLSEITLSSYTSKKLTPYYQKELLFMDLSPSQQQQAYSTKIWPYKKNNTNLYQSRQSDKDNSSCIIGPYTNFYLYNNEIKLPLYHKFTAAEIYNQLTKDSSDVEKTLYTNADSNSIYSACVPYYKWNAQYLKYFGAQSQKDSFFNYKYKNSENFINLNTNTPKYFGLTSLLDADLDGNVYKWPREETSYNSSDRVLTIQKEGNIITIISEEDSESYTFNSKNEKIIITIKDFVYTKELLTSIYRSSNPASTPSTTAEKVQNKYFGAYSCWDSVLEQRTYNWQAYASAYTPSPASQKYLLYSGASLGDTPQFSWSFNGNKNLSNLLGLYVNSCYKFYELIPSKLNSSQVLYIKTNEAIPEYLEEITDKTETDNLKKAFEIKTQIYEENQMLDFDTVRVPSTSAFEETWTDSGKYRFYVPSTNLYLSGQIEYTNIEPNYNTSVTANTDIIIDSTTNKDYSILNYWFNIKFNLIAMPMKRISLVNPYVNYTDTSPSNKPIWERSTDFYYNSKACLNRPYGTNISSLIRHTGFNIGINFDNSTMSSGDFMPDQCCPWGLLSISK